MPPRAEGTGVDVEDAERSHVKAPVATIPATEEEAEPEGEAVAATSRRRGTAEITTTTATDVRPDAPQIRKGRHVWLQGKRNRRRHQPPRCPNSTRPGSVDLIAVSSPDNGSDPITDDPTLTGRCGPRQFLGRRGGAGCDLRDVGRRVPPALGRILQVLGFTEVVNATPITGTALGGSTSSIQLAAAASATDDEGYPINHRTSARAGCAVRR